MLVDAGDLLDDFAVGARLATEAGNNEGGLMGSPMTPREREVLRLIAEGRSNKETAVELGLRPKTVMHHTTSIYRKLGVQSRTEAAAVAWRRGTLS